MNKYPTLLSPINVAGIEMRTRVFQSGMVSNLSNEDGTITDREIAYFVERAKNGVGLQIIGASFICQQAHTYRYQVGIDRDECLEGLKKLTDAVHAAGGKMGIQLWHSGSQGDPRVNGGMELVSCSAVPTPSGLVPRELTISEIKEIENLFADAAERAVKAGFDMVELHGSHGYLLDNFYSKQMNLRTDEYGGSFENRIRIFVETLRKIRERIGSEFPVSARITADDMMGDAGNTLEDGVRLANALVDAGAQIINVSGGGPLSIGTPDMPEAAFAHWAAAIKSSLGDRAFVSVANRIKRPEVAEYVLASGQSDLVTMGRALICDPELLTKAREGREEEIRLCTSCNYCIATMAAGNRTACIQNPRMGHELEYDLSVPAQEKKKVIVVGAGPAGLEAAAVAAARGHDVTVLEAADRIGGKVNVAVKPPFKGDMEFVINNLSREARQAGAEFRLNTLATKDTILAEEPDTVILATGAVPVLPPIPGLNQVNVFFAQDLLQGKKRASGKTVVIGGGTVGVETADYLLDKGHEVVIVEMQSALMMDLFWFQQLPFMMRVLPKLSAIMTDTTVTSVSGSTVFTNKGSIENVDSVVIAAGYKSVNGLKDELKESGIPVCTVGDATVPAKIFEATSSAYAAAYQI